MLLPAQHHGGHYPEQDHLRHSLRHWSKPAGDRPQPGHPHLPAAPVQRDRAIPLPLPQLVPRRAGGRVLRVAHGPVQLCRLRHFGQHCGSFHGSVSHELGKAPGHAHPRLRALHVPRVLPVPPKRHGVFLHSRRRHLDPGPGGAPLLRGLPGCHHHPPLVRLRQRFRA